jgi:hypothetical protein
MKSASEKYLIYFTLPSLIGITTLVIWNLFPPQWNAGRSNSLPNIEEIVLLCCGIVGVGSSFKSFFLVKSEYGQMRIGIIALCCLINLLWLIYVAYCVANPGPFHMQG